MRRRIAFSLALLATAITPATASAFFQGENKNTVIFTIFCGEFGTFTGSLPGGSNGSALLLEGGGVAIAQGLIELDGTVVIPVKPGLERQGKLVPCRFTFPGFPERIAFVQFVPPRS
jgi:hypothetical protein